MSSSARASSTSAPPPHAAVTGLQWGDEGKGKIVDLLAADHDVIVRYNGGANAGHSVVIGEKRYALHLVPCGILTPGRLNLIGNGVVVDPPLLLEEIASLRAAGVTVDQNLRLSERAHVVLPWHKQADALLESAMAAAAGEDSKIGTTGRGIGPCYADKATRTTAVRVVDLLDPSRLRVKLGRIAAVKNAMLAGLAEMTGLPFERIDGESLAGEYAAYGAALAPHVADTAALLHEAMDAGKRVLFEGGNGALLDVDHGSYPFVTSSSTLSLGIYPGAGLPGGRIGRLVGIVKAYSTRVGGGPMPTEQDNAVGLHLRERGREFGTTTGRPRRCGWLDLVALKHSARLSGATELAVMLLDVLAGLDGLQVCTHYRVGDRVVDRFPAAIEDLHAARPVLAALPGFGADIGACRRWEDLPAAARAYVGVIENYVGLPVSMVSVGPERGQTLMRGR
jgi:adenylosuccinate synthase